MLILASDFSYEKRTDKMEDEAKAAAFVLLLYHMNGVWDGVSIDGKIFDDITA